MKVITFFIFCTLSAHLLSQKAVWIIIHGTWSLDATWYRPGGDFFESLSTAVKNSNGAIVPFTWSGSLSHNSRLQAARSLKALIESYGPDTDIYLVGHSHGANVGILATQYLSQEGSHAGKIKCFFSFGAPVNNNNYYPAMDIIDSFYNLFSFEDLIQPVMWLFDREFTAHGRIMNVRIIINKKSPDHTQLHAPIIGQWLPMLKEVIENKRYTLLNNDIVIVFNDGKRPTCFPDPQRELLREKDQTLKTLMLHSRSQTIYDTASPLEWRQAESITAVPARL
jgi:Lipase (class 3)